MASNNNKVQQSQNLPLWDLADLYSSANTAQLVDQDTEKLAKLVSDFSATYENKITSLNAAQLLQAVKKYEIICELAGKLASYAYLAYTVALNNSAVTAFYQNVQEKITFTTTSLIFFQLEINLIDDNILDALLNDAELARYHTWFMSLRSMKPFQLTDAEERLLHEKSITSSNAWVRLFDETLESLRFHIDGEVLSSDLAINLLSDPSPDKRKSAALEISRVFAENQRIFSFIMNTLLMDKAIEDRKRGLAQPISARNIANQIEDDVVQTLINVVKDNYSSLSHRYYKLKATMFGKEKLSYWDRNAPLPGDECQHYTWQEAQDIVLAAYKDFSPQMADMALKFFSNKWIDAAPKPGKMSGAFAHPTVPSAHPYLLLNFSGKIRDVMTLAHELGHGVHQILAAKQGPILANTPLTLAETASVFAEQLVFRKILATNKDANARKIMIANKVEDMLNTVVRQIAFCEFEQKLHSARSKGELSAEQIGELWMQIQQESLGDAFTFDEGYSYYWMYISHFFHAPFYVYAYAFGDCLVNSLYGLYRKGYPNFEEKYFQLLSAGGSVDYKELLAKFDLNPQKAEFWQHGLNTIKELIDELEK